MPGPYINDDGYEVPENTILVVPHAVDHDGFYKEILKTRLVIIYKRGL
jgi:hypothetical protein